VEEQVSQEPTEREEQAPIEENSGTFQADSVNVNAGPSNVIIKHNCFITSSKLNSEWIFIYFWIILTKIDNINTFIHVSLNLWIYMTILSDLSDEFCNLKIVWHFP
jgi:hypothetical protein